RQCGHPRAVSGTASAAPARPRGGVRPGVSGGTSPRVHEDLRESGQRRPARESRPPLAAKPATTHVDTLRVTNVFEGLRTSEVATPVSWQRATKESGVARGRVGDGLAGLATPSHGLARDALANESVTAAPEGCVQKGERDRKSTRLNSSH